MADWKDIAVLSVGADRLAQWYMPGMLLIRDAAHIMSPVGGVGVNYAIQDTVVAANEWAQPLKAGPLLLDHPATVQRQREWPTRAIQAFPAQIQRPIVASSLNTNTPFRLPLPLRFFPRIPLLRNVPARMITFGVNRFG